MKMKYKALFFAAVCTCLSLAACSSENDFAEPAGTATMSTRAVGVNDFGLELLSALAEDCDSSVALSPLSVTYAVAMLAEGSSREMSNALADALGFPPDSLQAMRDFCSYMTQNLPRMDHNVSLNIANALFLRQELTPSEGFSRVMRQTYLADMESLDFSKAASLDRINTWCNDNTHGMIPHILSSLDSKATFYLLNTIHLQAPWAMPFEASKTYPQTFITSHGNSIDIPMMHQRGSFDYAITDQLQAVRLKYGDGTHFGFTVIMPTRQKDMSELARMIRGYGLSELMSQMRSTDIVLALPKFQAYGDNDLRKYLFEQRLPSSVGNVPDNFPRMFDGGVDGGVSKCQQKVSLLVAERGTEASSATVIEHMGSSTGHSNSTAVPLIVNIDRPFIYMITEFSTGNIIFIGTFNPYGHNC